MTCNLLLYISTATGCFNFFCILVEEQVHKLGKSEDLQGFHYTQILSIGEIYTVFRLSQLLTSLLIILEGRDENSQTKYSSDYGFDTTDRMFPSLSYLHCIVNISFRHVALLIFRIRYKTVLLQIVKLKNQKVLEELWNKHDRKPCVLWSLLHTNPLPDMI